jgi:maltooligosyltrehalose trehalohydrolase
VLFEVWAPLPDKVELALRGGRHPMQRDDRGRWRIDVDAAHGDDYGFVLDDGDVVKDPRSRWQPDGSAGLSRVHELTFPWTDDGWRGVPLAGSVIYELHVGTFTAEGTFDAAIDRLDHLVDLGIDLVEVLPVNGFGGDRGWGYDGVDLFAVHRAYGGPDAFARFVDAAHARGLAVVLDVVFNHLGPSGNVLPLFGPYLTETYTTTWGPAVNLDQAGSHEVRAFFVDCALQWLRDLHCDGLRLDAVHAFQDRSAMHLLEQLARAVDSLAVEVGRDLLLIAESDLNDPRMVDPGGTGLDGMWGDDLHHCLHTLLTGERDGYYEDFGTLEDLATAWSSGLLFTGRWSRHRDRTIGRPLPWDLPGHRIVVSLQNHDQIGNRAVGDRLPADLLRLGAPVVLLSPMTPMLFMGEEWAARTPWAFVSGHEEPELAEAVRTGRRTEFASFGWDPALVPDPVDPATFKSSQLDWSELDDPEHAAILDWYVALLRLRRAHPGHLADATATFDEDAGWIVLRRGDLEVALNLSAERRDVPVRGSEVALHSHEPPSLDGGLLTLPGCSVCVLVAA